MIDEYFPFSDLVNFSDDDFTDGGVILIKNDFFFDFLDTLVEILFRAHDKPASETLKVDDLDKIVSNVQRLVGFLTNGLQIDLHVRIGDRFDDLFLEIDLNIPFIHVHNDVKSRFQAVLLTHHHRKDVFNDAREHVFIHAFLARHLRKRFYNFVIHFNPLG